MMIRQGIFIWLLSIFILSCAGGANSRNHYTDAEKVAQTYMRAIFNGDTQTVLSHMHPTALKEMRLSFLHQLDKVRARSQEANFLYNIGVEQDGATLEKMNPTELFVALVEADHKKDEKAFEEMKKTKVKIINSKILDHGSAIVSLQISTPSDNGFKDEMVDISLLKHGETWKVWGNANN